MVEPTWWTAPSGRVQVATRLGVRVSVQRPSWTRWWCFSHMGSKLSMSVGPRSRAHYRMWWILQFENPTVQSGCAHPTLVTAAGPLVVGGHSGRLLAVLASRRRGMTIDELTQVLWPDGIPKTARSALQAYPGRSARRCGRSWWGPRSAES